MRSTGSPQRRQAQRTPEGWRENAPPAIVCLCGSTRFVDVFNHYRKTLTENGEIVLSIEVVTTQAREDDPQHADPDLKTRLDELHKRKIDLADYCLIVSDETGYFGEVRPAVRSSTPSRTASLWSSPTWRRSSERTNWNWSE